MFGVILSALTIQAGDFRIAAALFRNGHEYLGQLQLNRSTRVIHALALFLSIRAIWARPLAQRNAPEMLVIYVLAEEGLCERANRAARGFVFRYSRV